MRILVLAPHPFYIDRGTPIDVDILVRALCELGHEVHLATLHAGEDRHYDGLTIHRIEEPKGVGMPKPGFSGAKLKCDVKLFALAKRLIREIKPDVIHAGEEAVFMARWFKMTQGIPYVYDMDSSIAQQMVEQIGALRFLSPIFHAMEGIGVKGAVACAPVCHALADVAKKQGAKRSVTLHDISQLEVEALEPTGWLRERCGIGESSTLIVYCGNLQEYQGVGLLIEGMAEAIKGGADVDAVIAGGEPAQIQNCKEQARKLGIEDRIHLIGRWPADKLGELLIEGDILTAPRIKGVNTPQKVFPYLHTGRAVLVTDLPTHSQILTPEVCRLAPADPVGFGSAIADLASDREKCETLGQAGRKFAEAQHTYPAHRRRVRELYAEVSAALDLNN
ncbi:MAG TPA: glycosyltransferase [Phycisphaerales bacterium]|nr:glycosyltransferase [Phycisphaerales bacterium]